MIMDVTPVAHAVIVAVMGPVAPVKMDILPPTMLMHELGLAYGGGILPSAIMRRSAARTASWPPIAELKVTATRGASSGLIAIPLFASARCTTSIAYLKIGDGQSARLRGFKKA